MPHTPNPAPTSGDGESAGRAPEPVINPHNASEGAAPSSRMTRAVVVLAVLSASYYLNMLIMVDVVFEMMYGESYENNNLIRMWDGLLVGQLIGLIIFGLLCDIFGQKISLFASTAVMLVGAVLCTAARGVHSNTSGLLAFVSVARGIIGVGIGGVYPAASNVEFEVVDNRTNIGRRAYMAMTNGLFTSEHGNTVWPICTGLGIIFLSAAICYTSIWHIPKRGGSYSLPKLSVYSSELKQHWIKMARVCCVWFIYNFVVFPKIALSGVILYDIVDNNVWKAAGFKVLLDVFSISGSLAGARLCDAYQRRNIITVSFTGYVIFALIIGCAYDRLINVAPLLGIFYALMLFMGNLGPGNLLSLMTVESYPSNVRGSFYGATAAFGTVGAIAGTHEFSTIDENLRKQWGFIIAAICGLFGVFVAYFLPADPEAQSSLSDTSETQGQPEEKSARPGPPASTVPLQIQHPCSQGADSRGYQNTYVARNRNLAEKPTLISGPLNASAASCPTMPTNIPPLQPISEQIQEALRKPSKPEQLRQPDQAEHDKLEAHHARRRAQTSRRREREAREAAVRRRQLEEATASVPTALRATPLVNGNETATAYHDAPGILPIPLQNLPSISMTTQAEHGAGDHEVSGVTHASSPQQPLLSLDAHSRHLAEAAVQTSIRISVPPVNTAIPTYDAASANPSTPDAQSLSGAARNSRAETVEQGGGKAGVFRNEDVIPIQLPEPQTDHNSIPEVRHSVASQSVTVERVPNMQESEEVIANHVASCGLQKFFNEDSDFVKTVAANAAKLQDDGESFPITKPNVERLIRLSLYYPVIYCDDSGSMSWGVPSRWSLQGDAVRRIANIATRALPEQYGVGLRFINAHPTNTDNIPAANVIRAVDQVSPFGGTPLGTNMRQYILKPLVYDVLDGNRLLERPILVCIITDGCPNGDNKTTFEGAIRECRQRLVDAGYEPAAVRFCVNQIGDDAASTRFLDSLRNNSAIADVTYCTTERLDEQYKEFKENKRLLDEWLLKMLSEPIMHRHTM
ncbi:MFS general substrate transporter [Daedalea quercina L-15889]|uniref:MFS general substrate transporter n=1 Tax=Daedalea quercina L-15889 TaxID=1314783 RepID=A0A165S8D9_9APHY|nr:MFS general substrate transporter [Daedalea quercina L-15889]